jgi:hypothetical protein
MNKAVFVPVAVTKDENAIFQLLAYTGMNKAVFVPVTVTKDENAIFELLA